MPVDESQHRVSDIEAAALRSRQAALRLKASSHTERNEALKFVQSQLLKQHSFIEAANRTDVEAAASAVESGRLDNSIYKRLELFTGNKFESCVSLGIDDVIAKQDPLGVCDLATELTDGLKLYRVSCPIGVLLVIFEARPEVSIQIASLALKSGNALILKGGHEAKVSNHAIVDAIRAGLKQSSVPEDCIQLIDTREEVSELLKLDSLIDLVIPRGSKNLVQYTKANTKIPVLGHADGLCIAFVNEDANIEQSVKVIVDCKTDYPAACNAVETLLVHEKIVPTFLPVLAKRLEPFEVQFRSDLSCLEYLPSHRSQPACDHDFFTEFLSHTLAVKAVSSMDDAICHINGHGSHHTDLILTEDLKAVNEFMDRVDSAGVYHNCSTRFADGYRYGFGAEVGISTGRIHSRGPCGLEGLLIYKYKLFGRGNTVGEMTDLTDKHKRFTHQTLPLPSQVDARVIQRLPRTTTVEMKR